ncbi:ABC transporter ATP-binding protein [Frankia nepalensis]|uniref:ABC transporter ATP-binding protein n=1 Tax=Frankia nepalensis TaxID=1836974 RepID=UPI001932804A|nr:ABC transporter ATP-binding protein [Frankia nepalensis]MBL7499675.1 ABC transporter ATP-binding protein [Frankia nepalensis]
MPSRAVEPEEQPRGAILRLVPVLRRHRRTFVATVGCSLATHLTSIAAVATGAAMVAEVAGGASLRDVGWLLTLLAGLVLGHATAYWAEMWVAHDLAFKVLAALRLEVFDGLERTAPGGLLGRRTGEVAGTAMADVETLEWFYAHTAATALAAVLAPLCAVGVVGVLAGPPAAVLAAGLAVVAVVPFVGRRRADEQGRAIRAELAGLKAAALDGVQGLRELVVFGGQAAHTDRLLAATRAVNRRARRYALRTGVESSTAEFVLAATAFGVLALGVRLLVDGDLTFTAYSVMVVVATGAFVPLMEAFAMVTRFGELRAAAARVFEVVDAAPNVAEPPATAGAVPRRGGDTDQAPSSDSRRPAPSGPLDVCFRDVRFRYRPGLPLALDGVSFTVPAGATVALVGRSGAGKTTIAHLLLRFWDATRGEVLLGGRAVGDLSQHEVRELVSLVPQDVYLFNTTVAHNVRLARPDASDAEVADVCERALVTEFADSLPAGLDTPVGERGAALSGGQRQRVAVARALLRDPAVLVLDEAASNLDADSERAVAAATAEARRGRTTLIIAHRLSTVRDADLVVVLDGGRVVEQGRPEDLLTGSGPFASLMRAQLG